MTFSYDLLISLFRIVPAVFFFIIIVKTAPALGSRIFRLNDNFKQSILFRFTSRCGAVIGLYVFFEFSYCVGLMLTDAGTLASYIVGYTFFLLFESLFALLMISTTTAFFYVILSIFNLTCGVQSK